MGLPSGVCDEKLCVVRGWEDKNNLNMAVYELNRNAWSPKGQHGSLTEPVCAGKPAVRDGHVQVRGDRKTGHLPNTYVYAAEG